MKTSTIRMFAFNAGAAIMSLCCSCTKADTPDDSILTFYSFELETVSGVVPGVIDEVSSTVTFPGIADPLSITGAEYDCGEGVSVYPDPAGLAGKWTETQQFVLRRGDRQRVFSAILPDCEQAVESPDAVIYPSGVSGRVTRYFFFDLKGGPNSLAEEQKAALLFGTDGMNGVRIPIYGDAKNGGHTASGVIGEGVYDKVLASVANARKYSKGDLLVFASKKLDGKDSFPDWVMESGKGIKPEKYAEMLMDYLRYMKSQGVEVDVLGIDNETNFNEGNITPEKFAAVVDIVREKTAAEGLKVPLMIGPERYNPELEFEQSWIKTLFDDGLGDRMDIYGTHYYPKHHKPNYFKALESEFGCAQTGTQREFWATEPHWDNDDEAKADMLYHAEQALCAMFDQTDLGLDGFMWWAYPADGTLRGQLMRAYSLALYGSRPVRMTDHDGEDTMTRGLLQTRAYVRGDEINVFIINMCAAGDKSGAKAYDDYLFEVSGAEISGNINVRQWSDETPDSGSSSTIKPEQPDRFRMDIPSRTITMLTFHFFDIDAANNADTWNDQNNIAYLDNGMLRQNVPYDKWAVFFDKDRHSTYGSTDDLTLN